MRSEPQTDLGARERLLELMQTLRVAVPGTPRTMMILYTYVHFRWQMTACSRRIREG